MAGRFSFDDLASADARTWRAARVWSGICAETATAMTDVRNAYDLLTDEYTDTSTTQAPDTDWLRQAIEAAR